MNFKPTDISSCVLWHDAAVGVQLDSSGYVSQWNDLSGSNNHSTQATAGSRPWLSTAPRPAVVFEIDRTANLELSTNFASGFSPSACTFLVVLDLTQTGRQFVCCLNGNGNAAMLIGRDSDTFGGEIGLWTGTGQQMSGLRIHAGPALTGFRGGSSNWSAFVNAQAWTSSGTIGGSASGNSGSNRLRLGAWFGGGSSTLEGRIEAVFAWSKALTDAEYARMLDYCEWKHRIVRNPRVVVGFAGTSTVWGEDASRGQTIARRCADAGVLDGAKWMNWGQPTVTIATLQGTDDDRLDPMLIDGTPGVLYAQLGSNDLYGTDTSAATAYASLLSYLDDRRAAGWDRIVVGPVQPRQDDTQGTVDFSVRRAAFNDLLVEGSGLGVQYDAAVDWRSDPVLERVGIQNDLNFYNADTIHWEDPAFERAASYIIPVLAEQIRIATSAPRAFLSEHAAVIDEHLAVNGRAVQVRLVDRDDYDATLLRRNVRSRGFILIAVRSESRDAAGFNLARGAGQRLTSYTVRASDLAAGGRRPRRGDVVEDAGEAFEVLTVSEQSDGVVFVLGCGRVK